MTDPSGPISFSYDASARRRTALFSGSITDADLLHAYAALIAQDGYDYAADDLADLRGVTHLAVTEAGMGALLELFGGIDRLGVRTRLAIVSPGDDVFGVSRMYKMLRGEGAPEEVGVFRDMALAMAWLDRGPIV